MRTSSSLGPLEKEVMDIVWQQKKVSVKQVAVELSNTHSLAYTTVLTILSRLWKKGLLERNKTGKSSFNLCKYGINKEGCISIIRSGL